MSTGEQLDVLDGFKNSRFNILVATTVVEEGLDVRACNVVIKADELTNFRSFIQAQACVPVANLGLAYSLRYCYCYFSNITDLFSSTGQSSGSSFLFCSDDGRRK